ncbi:hypothetical protein FOZ62_028495 [Perkinsus olseni]|uniref:Uncharacterized protein n=1 Tax=Perkinsus olseni TaxID=32597 RepID=A0A7J6PQF5_PEROL|nr:hypothetical protein FOZ62_028495 [Perkinsus olseni]
MAEALPDDESSYFRRLRGVFGGRFLIGLHIIQHIVKGFVCGGGDSGLAGTPIDFVLRDYRVSGADLQLTQPVASDVYIGRPEFSSLSRLNRTNSEKLLPLFC